MQVFAIDPGPYMSAWVYIEVSTMAGLKFLSKGKENNPLVIEALKSCISGPDGKEVIYAVERIQSYGGNVGAETFDCCVFIGRLIEIISSRIGREPYLPTRPTIKAHHCGNPRANDAAVRAALLDKFPATGGGKVRQVGTKSQPGPLFGVTADVWQALALALYVSEEGRFRVE